MKNEKTWNPEKMAALLDTMSGAQLAKSLLALWDRQTEDEKRTSTTRYQNGRGFSGYDAEFAGRLVSWWNSKKFFTQKQGAALCKMLKKYRRQLADIANKKEEEPARTDFFIGFSDGEKDPEVENARQEMGWDRTTTRRDNLATAQVEEAREQLCLFPIRQRF